MSETNEDRDYDRSDSEVILLEPIGEEDQQNDIHDPSTGLSEPAGVNDPDVKKSYSEGTSSEPEWDDDIDDPEVRLLDSDEGMLWFEIDTLAEFNKRLDLTRLLLYILTWYLL